MPEGLEGQPVRFYFKGFRKWNSIFSSSQYTDDLDLVRRWFDEKLTNRAHQPPLDHRKSENSPNRSYSLLFKTYLLIVEALCKTFISLPGRFSANRVKDCC